jgi:hypothetical protein
MNITSAQYGQNINKENENVRATIDGVEMCVPLDQDNRHYAEILRQVSAGTLTIKEAD